MTNNVNIAINAALIGYNRLKDNKRLNLISKGGIDASTELDYELEDETRTYLKSATGESVFGEERGGDRNSTWVLDKIDGTANFRIGLDLFGSAVTHLDGDSADITVVALPRKNELYLAIKNQGAYLVELPDKINPEELAEWENNKLKVGLLELTGKKLKTTVEDDPKKSVIAADTGYKNRKQKLAQIAKYAQDVFYSTILGSASYSLRQLAAGRLNGYAIFDVDMNDILSGQLLVEEAGGITSDLEGNPVTRATRTLVAAGNKEIHRFLIRKLNK